MKGRNLKSFSPAFFLFFFSRVSMWKDFHQNTQDWSWICYRNGTCTVSRRVCPLFSPEILQVAAVKGLDEEPLWHSFRTACTWSRRGYIHCRCAFFSFFSSSVFRFSVWSIKYVHMQMLYLIPSGSVMKKVHPLTLCFPFEYEELGLFLCNCRT